MRDVEESYLADVDYHMKQLMEEQITEQQVHADLLSGIGQSSVDEDISVQTVNETPRHIIRPDAGMFFTSGLHHKSGMELTFVNSILQDIFREIIFMHKEIMDIRKQTPNPISPVFNSDDYLAEIDNEMNSNNL